MRRNVTGGPGFLTGSRTFSLAFFLVSPLVSPLWATDLSVYQDCVATTFPLLQKCRGSCRTDLAAFSGKLTENVCDNPNLAKEKLKGLKDITERRPLEDFVNCAKRFVGTGNDCCVQTYDKLKKPVNQSLGILETSLKKLESERAKISVALKALQARDAAIDTRIGQLRIEEAALEKEVAANRADEIKQNQALAPILSVLNEKNMALVPLRQEEKQILGAKTQCQNDLVDSFKLEKLKP